MGYNPSTKKITAPVSIEDIRQALVVQNNTLSRTLGALCKAPGINPWAKYKPVPYNDKFPTANNTQFDISTKTWKSTATWWKGNQRIDLNEYFETCGFRVPVRTTPNGLIALYKTSEDAGNEFNGWELLRPNGGNTDPYRTSDFIGYNGGSTTFATELRVPSEIDLKQGVTAEINFMSRDTISDMVNVGDLFPYGIYLGIIITTNPSGSSTPEVKFWKINTNLNSLIFINDFVPENNLENDTTYRLYPFIVKAGTDQSAPSKLQGTSGTEIIANSTTFYGTGVRYKTFTTKNTGLPISVDFSVRYPSASGGNGKIDAYVTITNGSGSYNGTLTIRKSDNTVLKTIYNITINSGGNIIVLPTDEHDTISFKTGQTYTATLVIDNIDQDKQPDAANIYA